MNTPQGAPGPHPSPPGRPVPPFVPPRQPSPRPRLNYFKGGFTCLLGFYGLVCAVHPQSYRFLDWVDLVFHEAGHVVFGFFGEFIGILGGSLMEVLIPVVVTGYFILYHQRWSGMVTLFWVGQSLFNVSVYVKDARAQALPLLGGDDTIHDWNWILGRLHLLRWDHVIGNAVYLLGLVVIVASVLGGLYCSREDETTGE